MIYNNIKKIPFLWKFLTRIKDRLIILSRLKDVLMMMLLLHFWPEQTYRFSTRKLLPSKRNRFSKESRPVIPYNLQKNNSSNILKMKEINVIGKGSSFDLNNIKKINGPIFLISFNSPLKIDENGKIFYKNYFSYKTGKKISREESFIEQKKYKDYLAENITYGTGSGRVEITKLFKESGYNIVVMEVKAMNNDGNCLSEPTLYHNLIDNDQCKNIVMEQKIYRHPMPENYLNWAPAGSFLPSLCGLLFYAEKVNVYGWDAHLDSSPEIMGYWKLLFNMYNYKADVFRWNAHFEHALINFYYGYQLSKLPNINIYGYMGQLDKHEKLIKKIERVLFN